MLKKGMKRRLRFAVRDKVSGPGIKLGKVVKVLVHTWCPYSTKYLVKCKANDHFSTSYTAQQQRAAGIEEKWYRWPMRETSLRSR